jgi:hypothetical protein
MVDVSDTPSAQTESNELNELSKLAKRSCAVIVMF